MPETIEVIAKTSWYEIKAQEETAEVSIFGDIGEAWWGDSVTLADFKKDFDKIKDRKSINVSLNSPGGDVFDGMGIYNMISQVQQKVTVEVLGLAASIASIIALAGKKLIMGEGTYFMIHRPWAFSMGDADELRKSAELLDKIQGQMVSIYERHSYLTDEDIVAALTEETWYTAQEAVDAGFATDVVDYGEVAASADLSKYKYAHVPAGMVVNEENEGPPTTVRQFEERVGRMGFSNSEARAIASRGFPHRDDVESEVEPEAGVEPEAAETIEDPVRVRMALLQSRKQLIGVSHE